jgi:hypothetical protein
MRKLLFEWKEKCFKIELPNPFHFLFDYPSASLLVLDNLSEAGKIKTGKPV